MILIIAHHYVVNSGLMELNGPIDSNPFAFKSIFLLLFGVWGKTCINCFVLITGYFMCNSRITSHKFFKLLFEICFYHIVVFLVFLISGYESFTWTGFLRAFLPITSVADSFSGCFLLFYLCIPFLNVLIRNLNKKQHFYLLILIAFIYIVLGTIPRIEVVFNYVTWFICLYFIGSFLRLYPINIFNSKKVWFIVSLIITIVSSASVILLQFISYKYGYGKYSYLLADSNKILAVMTSVSWFLLFKNINIKHSKIINIIGSATFGVFLIHANSDAMRRWLWQDLLRNVEMYDNGNWIYVHAICSVLGIFIVCTLIDIIRQLLIEKPFMKLWDKLWNRVSIWYHNKEKKLFNENNVDE